MALERDISTAALRVADRAPHEVALQRDGAVTRAKLTEQARVVFDLLRATDAAARQREVLIRRMRGAGRCKRAVPWQEAWAQRAWPLLLKFRKATMHMCPLALHRPFAVHVDVQMRQVLAASFLRARHEALHPRLLRTHTEETVGGAMATLAFDVTPSAIASDRTGVQHRGNLEDCTVQWFKDGN